MIELEKLRKEINDWDEKIVEAFEKRMEVVLKILEYKRNHSLPIFHQDREKEILEKVTSNLKNPSFKGEIEELYIEIMRISRKRQSIELFPYNIVLIGFMGSGKSTIGKWLSEKLEMDLLDTDSLIEDKMKRNINLIFQEYGEEYFRKIEKNTIKELSDEKNKIIACGGGVALNEENIQYLKKNGKIIYLETKVENIYDRLRGDTSRPLLKNSITKEYIKDLLNKREAYYQRAADFIISTDGKEENKICDEIIMKLLCSKTLY